MLSDKAHQGKCVVYVMSRDQRVADNHALYAAQATALQANLPLVVCFNLLGNAGHRGQEHYTFMLSGLEELAVKLQKLNINFLMTSGSPLKGLPKMLRNLNPQAVFFDFSPLHGPRSVAKHMTEVMPSPVYVVDTHNIVPVWATSRKQEFAAHTIRHKINKLLESMLVEPGAIVPHPHTFTQSVPSVSFEEAKQIVAKLPKRGITIEQKPGEDAAAKHLAEFISTRLEHYALKRNDPGSDTQSDLSPNLHFGHISSLRVALEVLYAVDEIPLLFTKAKMAQAGSTPSKADGMNALFEEMIVRKELSDNFCLYAPSYSSLHGVPEWAKETLKQHESDHRDITYSLSELEYAKTHDPAWNAAQRQMTQTGKMHGYMRMYWAKKILEWSPNADTALAHAIYLNDAYSIDGGDPNGYVGILWSIAGLHDRPWTERRIFGKIRYMNETGLRRKFDIDGYIASWQP
jgi:deoxyribodipyrimidine photo-lyase